MYVINFIARDFLRTKYNSGHAGNRIKTRNSFSEFINGDKSTTTMASLTSSDLEEMTTEYQGNFLNLINTGLLTELPRYIIVFLIYIFSSRLQTLFTIGLY